MSRLTLPSRKMCVSDLAHCKTAPALAEEETVSTQHLTTWKHQTAFKSTEFSMVWVQGEVTYAELSEGCLMLNDTTGVVTIIGMNKLPQGCPPLNKGDYIMVVGELKESGSDPVIKANKIQDLSKDSIAQEMWPIEVKDLHLYS